MLWFHRGSLDFPTSLSIEETIRYYSNYSQNCSGRRRHGWKDLSSFEKCLSLSLFILGSVSVGLIIGICFLGRHIAQTEETDYSGKPIIENTTIFPPWITTTTSTARTTTRAPTVCATPECIQNAANILSWSNNSVLPCDNFYEFACGRFKEKHYIPDTSSRWGQFDILREQLSRNIRVILETFDEDDPLPVSTAKDFYQTCMNQTNEQNHGELLALNERLVGGFDDVNKLGIILGGIRKEFEGNSIITAYVELNDRNTTINSIFLDQPRFGLAREYLLQNSTFKNSYTELIANVWRIVYLTDEVRSREIADDIVNFEASLANISTAAEDRRDKGKMFNPMTLEELKEFTSTATMLNWDEFFNALYAEIVDELSESQIIFDPLKETFIVRDKPFFAEIGNALSSTTLETMKNYLEWRTIFEFGNEVSITLRDIFFDYAKKTLDVKFPEPMWKSCSDKANNFFGMAIALPYTQKHFRNEYRARINLMVGNIREAFISETNDGSEWIGNATKLKVLEKLEKMQTFMAFPDWLQEENSTTLIEYYANLTFSNPDNHLQNFLDVSKWINKIDLKYIVELKNNTKWLSDPTVVNAFYSSIYNSITFPAGIIQTPFYGGDVQSLNYGAIGAVIGHEIVHGFDDRGRQNNGDGDLNDWWDPETVQRFNEKAQCFVEQYGNYSIEVEGRNMTLNGQNTLGENIADNGGLRRAYKAWDTATNGGLNDQILPGVYYPPQQLFFISFAQIWCGAYTPKALDQQITNGVHSPNMFRVKGVLENSVEFAQAFYCPLPPEERCEIW